MEKYHVGVFIKDLLEANDLNQQKLADLSGASRDHIVKIIKGVSNMGVDTANQIAEYLGVKPGFLLSLQSIYDRHVESKEFCKKYKLNFSKIEGVAPLAELNIKSFINFQNSTESWVRNNGIVNRMPSKAKQAKQFALIKILDSIHSSKMNEKFDKKELNTFLRGEFKENLQYVKTPEDAVKFIGYLTKKINDLNINFSIINSGLKTTIKGISKINDNRATVLVEYVDDFASLIFTAVHEFVHLLIDATTYKDLYKKRVEEEEKYIDLIALSILIGDYGSFLDDINEKDFDEKIDGVNKYVLYSAWAYKKGIHGVKKNSDLTLKIKEKNVLYS